jgi:DNA replication protein DnaC
MMVHPLLPKLKELKLGGILETLEHRSEQARREGLSPIEFLALLIDDEIERRRQSSLLRREREAGFEHPKRLAQFDFTAIPTLDRGLVIEMAQCEFVTRHENWLVSGPTGVGKSHLAASVGLAAIERGFRVACASTHKLLGDLFAARADGSYPRRMQRWVTVDLLILDDFGLRPIAPTGAEDLYEIIQRRYERGSILLTSNRDPREWGELFGDPLLASAALDRLTHHARLTTITGESYRQRHRRQEGGLPPNGTE